MSFVRVYDYVMQELADPRVQEWSLVNSPAPTLIIAALYLSTIYVFLPAYMKNRKPYDLKKFIQYYNIFQIVACLALIYGILTSGWTTEYNYICQPVDYSNRPIAVRMLSFVYYTYLLKLIELTETFIFILRKKTNQVTNLHVYHHCSTFMLGWVGVKFLGGGMATFPIVLNCCIHVLMYTYYLLSSLGPKWQRRLAKWKPRLTMAQMIQFCILIVHGLTTLNPNCDVPKQVLLIYLPNVTVIFYMFWDFYKKSYLKKSQKSS